MTDGELESTAAFDELDRALEAHDAERVASLWHTHHGSAPTRLDLRGARVDG